MRCIFTATTNTVDSVSPKIHSDQTPLGDLRSFSVHKLVSQGLGLEQGAACHPPDPHEFSLVEETHDLSGKCVSFSFIGAGSGFTA